jgi:phage terminase Nu1 subunit (DNA packaging protein)
LLLKKACSLLESLMSDDTSLLVNQKELARALGVSINTARALLDRFPDLPVAERGSNGREYRFDLQAVQTFLKAKRDAEDAAQQQRSELLAQLILPVEGTAPESLRTLEPKDRLIAARAALVEDELAIKQGALVWKHEARAEMTGAIGRWNRATASTIRQIGRDMNLPDAVTRVILSRVEELQRQFVRELRAYADSSTPDMPPIPAEPELRFG